MLFILQAIMIRHIVINTEVLNFRFYFGKHFQKCSVPDGVRISYRVRLTPYEFNSVRMEYGNQVVIFPQLSPAVNTVY